MITTRKQNLSCTVKITFNAAKRLRHYEGKCAHLHGYRHEIEASFTTNVENSDTGDHGDMVADFYMLEEILGRWINDNWDHNVILNQDDSAMGNSIAQETGQEIFYLKGDPTAENLAIYIMNEVCPNIFPDNLRCVRIRLHDNENAFVELGSVEF